MARLMFLVLVALLLAVEVRGQSDPNEANALIIIKQSAGAPLGLITWNGTDPCGSAWLGVQCTPANGDQTRYVTGLQLPGFGLTGTLSPALGQLPNLQILDLSRNELEGGIPREFRNLTQLEQLDLHNNHLVATLDPWIGFMPRLVRMDLSQNSVWGPLPDSLFRLRSLQQLNLGGCIFTGNLPPTVANLGNLQLLNLSSNYLKGFIPAEIGQMTQLQALLLPNNSFSGSIPPELANITDLNFLYLQGNNLSGPIPQQLTAMPNLIARVDGNPLCQQLENQPFCAANAPPLAVGNLSPMPPPAPINATPGVIIPVATWNVTGNPVVSSQTPQNGTCVPGSTQGCVCATGQPGGGVCSGDGMAVLNCTCDPAGSSGDHWSTTATVLVAVLPAVFVLALVALCCCCATICLRRRNRGEREKNLGLWKDDLERAGIERQAPVGAAGFERLTKGNSTHVSSRSTTPGGASTTPYPTPPSSNGTRLHSPLGENGDFKNDFRSPPGQVTNPLYDAPGGAANPLFSEGAFGSLDVLGGGDPHKVFAFGELANATEGFSLKHLIGSSGFGRTYLAAMGGKTVVIKRLHELRDLGVLAKAPPQDRFPEQAALMSRLEHPHLIHLVGYCNQGKERCLVFPYIPNKSLQERLHGTTSPRFIEWRRRLTIASESAGALACLHQHGIIHRNFCSSNVLLDEDMAAVVSDFGTVRWSVEEGRVAEEVTSLLIGAGGYMAPEYGQGGVTEKADVYSFGVVLLELMTGRPAVSRDGVALAQWAGERMQNDPKHVEGIIDPQLEGSWPSIPFFWTVELAQACIDPDPAARPAMADVERAINFVLQHASETPAAAQGDKKPGHSRVSSGSSLGYTGRYSLDSGGHNSRGSSLSSMLAGGGGEDGPAEDKSDAARIDRVLAWQ